MVAIFETRHQETNGNTIRVLWSSSSGVLLIRVEMSSREAPFTSTSVDDRFPFRLPPSGLRGLTPKTPVKSIVFDTPTGGRHQGLEPESGRERKGKKGRMDRHNGIYRRKSKSQIAEHRQSDGGESCIT
jgi:hypothetical protein